MSDSDHKPSLPRTAAATRAASEKRAAERERRTRRQVLKRASREFAPTVFSAPAVRAMATLGMDSETIRARMELDMDPETRRVFDRAFAAGDAEAKAQVYEALNEAAVDQLLKERVRADLRREELSTWPRRRRRARRRSRNPGRKRRRRV